MAPSLFNYQILVIDETRGYRVDAFRPPQNKRQLELLYNHQSSSPVSRVTLELAIFAGAVSNPATTKVNMPVKRTQIIAQRVYKMSALITAQRKLRDVQPLSGMTTVNAPSMEKPVSSNTSINPTRAKLWTQPMSACALKGANVPLVKN